jgi:hypothetical protein
MAPPPLDIARVDVALEAAARTSEEFGFWTDADVCVSLYNDEVQWLLNCEDPNRLEFAGAPGRLFRDKPIYRNDAPVLLLDRIDRSWRDTVLT